MDHFLIPVVAAVASLITFFSGFGLGTLLMPVFAVFFPLPLAIAMTAIVHFLNGLFKCFLVGRHANLVVVSRFGLPAMGAAALGAWVLSAVSHLDPIATYLLGDRSFQVLPIKLVMGILIFSFTLLEWVPRLQKIEMSRSHLIVGGLTSGFFGGLSGHQGALRTLFLARAGLTKEQFVGTGALISVLIDIARIVFYSTTLSLDGIGDQRVLLGMTTLFAFLGAFAGNRLLSKITLPALQAVVSVSLIAMSIALGAGLI